jgi:hypothetical protein
MRDDFSEEAKRVLAARVGNRCSNPECRASTSGPQVDPARIVNIGVAAHITAASPGGPRYRREFSSETRSHPSNGIWLCQTCAKLADNDPDRFTEEALRGWKLQAERAAFVRLGKTDSLRDRHDLSLSPEAVELLRAANLDGGNIAVLSAEQLGRWVRAGRDYIDQDDPALAATYLEALEELCEQRLAKYDEGILYVLTGTGFKVARTMLAAEQA